MKTNLEESISERAEELENESVAMNRMFRNLKDNCRERILEITIEFYKEKENRRNPNKE